MFSKPVPVLSGQVVHTGHVEDIKFVINFDYPSSSEDYVHRIGRTGRSTNTGTAYTFFTSNNGRQASDLVNVLREAKQVISPKLLQLEEFSRGMKGGRNRWRGGFGNRGVSRFSNGGSHGSSSFRSRSNFSSSGSGGFKSQGGSGGFSQSHNHFNSSNGFSGGQKPFQNGTANTGGFNTQWNKGGVTAASLSSVKPQSTQGAAKF